MVQSAHLRGMPKQERGERSMQRLLDAAEQLFAEIGYKATTTNEIAARAHTSIGTLYRFFPNKDAIVHHLTERYLQDVQIVYKKMFRQEAATMPLEEMVDNLIEPMIELKEAHPGFISLFIDPSTALQIPAELQLNQREFILRIEQLWMMRFAPIDTETCHLYVVIFFQIVQALLSLAFSSTTLSREQVIKELKMNVFRYLEPIEEAFHCGQKKQD